MLRAAGTIRKVSVCLGLLVVSYLAAALINASPVRQPALASPYSRGRVIVLTPPQPGPAPLSFEGPAAGSEPTFTPAATPVQTL